MTNFDDRNSTVRWMPRWARNLLGLNSDYERPAYDRYSSDRGRMAEDGVGWVPGFVRSWLGLDFNEPKRYGPSSVYDPVAGQLVSGPGADPRRVAAPQAAASAARPAPRPAPEPMRAATPPPPAPSYRPATTGGGTTSGLDFRREASDGSAPSGYVPPSAGGRVAPGANLSGNLPPEGYVQPIGYLFRSYARGALPPEGLEAFTKQTRKTIEDVWDFYSYWLRFQTEELGRLGKEAAEAVGDAMPGSSGSQQPIRRIKVTTNGDTPAAAPAPVTPVAPPAPVNEPPPAADAPPAADEPKA